MAINDGTPKDRLDVEKIVDAAIAKSIVNNRIEHFDGWIEYLDYINGISRILEARSDEFVEEVSARKYSGKDHEGRRWRVHLEDHFSMR